jgi:hypothetical protein
MNGNTYVLKTLDDFRRIPPERLVDCLIDFASAVFHVNAMLAAAKAIAAEDGVVLGDNIAYMPEFKWIDDGKAGVGDIEIIDKDSRNV